MVGLLEVAEDSNLQFPPQQAYLNLWEMTSGGAYGYYVVTRYQVGSLT